MQIARDRRRKKSAAAREFGRRPLPATRRYVDPRRLPEDAADAWMRAPDVRTEDGLDRLHHRDLARMAPLELRLETHKALSMMATVDRRRDPCAAAWWRERLAHALQALTPGRVRS